MLADVSGSVAAFARFTLQLVHALASQFSKVRTFVFVDGIDEVTAIFERADHRDGDRAGPAGGGRLGPRRPLRLRDRPAAAPGALPEGRSIPGRRSSSSATPGTTTTRLRRASWPAAAPVPPPLLAQPRAPGLLGQRGLDGRQYAPFCDAMVECRNLRQLERFVDALT